jgi:hypothetical protein
MWTYKQTYPLELYHYGVKGMKWGVRRTPEQLRYNKNSIQTSLNERVLKNSTINGIPIRSVSPHVADRAAERKISVNEILDAIKKPLDITDIKIRNDGKRSQNFIGSEATVSVNPDTGKLITTRKTGTKLRENLLKRR